MKRRGYLCGLVLAGCAATGEPACSCSPVTWNPADMPRPPRMDPPPPPPVFGPVVVAYLSGLCWGTPVPRYAGEVESGVASGWLRGLDAYDDKPCRVASYAWPNALMNADEALVAAARERGLSPAEASPTPGLIERRFTGPSGETLSWSLRDGPPDAEPGWLSVAWRPAPGP